MTQGSSPDAGRQVRPDAGRPLTPEQQERAASAVGLVYTVMEHLRVPQAWHDEAESDGMLGLVHAARSFVPGKIGWGAFAYLCIERRIKNTFQRMHNHLKGIDADAPTVARRRALVGDVVIDPPVYGDMEHLPRHVWVWGQHAEEVRKLPRYVQQVLKMLFADGMNLRQAGQALGYSREQVRNIRNAALRALRGETVVFRQAARRKKMNA